jgi:MFS family permease
MESKQPEKLETCQITPNLLQGFKEVWNYEKKTYHLLILISSCVNVQYYSLIFFIPIYFSVEFGFSDLQSGVIFGLFGASVGFFSIVFSSVTFRVSMKSGLMFSFFSGILGFLLLMPGLRVTSLAGIFIQSVSCSLTWPYIEFGIKEHSKEIHRNICTSFYYISSYSAGILTGTLIDLLKVFTSDYKEIFIIIYSISIFSLLIASLLVLMCENCFISQDNHLRFLEILKDKKFYRFCILITLLVTLRSVTFGHMDCTLPMFIQRVHGKSSKFGSLISFYSVLMIFFTFFCTFFSRFFEDFSLIFFGAGFGLFALFPLMLSSEYFAFCIYVAATSIGESILTPRLLDYTFKIAEKQQEGVYLAVASLPYYFSMILTGTFSGFMMENYCITGNEKSCRNIWISSFFISFFLMFLMIILNKVVKVEGNLEKYTEMNEESEKNCNGRIETS